MDEADVKISGGERIWGGNGKKEQKKKKKKKRAKTKTHLNVKNGQTLNATQNPGRQKKKRIIGCTRLTASAILSTGEESRHFGWEKKPKSEGGWAWERGTKGRNWAGRNARSSKEEKSENRARG